MLLRERKLLLVEDDPEQVEIYSRELGSAGFEVLATNNADEAFEIAKNKKPNLILLDLMLGNASGLDILKKIKENLETKAIKVIAFTNFREKELLENERLEGIYDYIYKADFTPKEVARKLLSYLE